MIFRTISSTYEVDLTEQRIRRLTGSKDPTQRQGADGEWKRFHMISDIVVGKPVFIAWAHLNPAGLTPGTMTSNVIEIDPVHN